MEKEVMSIDGKVTGDFLYRPECEKATDIYYEINRNYKAEGFICGRVTMEGSFTNGWYPDLTQYEPVKHDMDLKMDLISDTEYMSGFYAVAFDPKGKLGWKSNKIEYELRDIKESNPTLEELSAWYKMSGLPLKKFFNTSGLLYKSMALKEKLPTMSEEEQLKLLATDGMLVKRPLVIINFEHILSEIKMCFLYFKSTKEETYDDK